MRITRDDIQIMMSKADRVLDEKVGVVLDRLIDHFSSSTEGVAGNTDGRLAIPLCRFGNYPYKDYTPKLLRGEEL